MAKQKSRIKTAATSIVVPQNREQAARAVADIGVANRELARITADMNDELAQVKERYEQAADPLRQKIEAQTDGLRIWADANRDQLTQHNKVKTAALTTGEIGWRTRPPSVTVRGAEAVLDALRRFGLGRFIRVKEEVNKEAILNEPEAVSAVGGISISQGEDFFVAPFETELAESAA